MVTEPPDLIPSERRDFILATYREIAMRFQLGGPNAARTKVKRARWASEPSNHPADPLRIRVPRDAWDQATEPPHLGRHEGPHLSERYPASQRRESPHLKALEDAVASLREQFEVANKGRDAADTRAERAEQALIGERQRADSLRDRLDALTVELRQAQEGASELRQAEIARRARGLLARLRDAWRGG